MAYYAQKEGTNYAVYQNGQRVSTTSASGLTNFGLSPTSLGSATPATPTPAAPTPAPAPAPNASPTTPSQTPGVLPNQPHPQTDDALKQLLANSSLTTDQKTAIQKAYDLVSTNDTAQANKLVSAFNAATGYSNPYFKAQTAIVTDALSRSLSAQEGDLSFKENQLQNTLNDLQQNTSASKDYLDFTHTQELQKLAASYKSDLDTTRQDLASRGLTSSSIRSNAEEMLNTNNQNLVESNNRQFSFQNNQYANQLSQGQRDYALQLQSLKDTTAAGKLDLLRNAESKVGSTALTNLGYSGLLGNQGGSIPQAQAQDALSFANNFVF